MKPEELEFLEIELLFEAIYRRYGYDFRQYYQESASRRVLHRVKIEGLSSVSELQHRVIHDEKTADALLQDLSINVTELFRNPQFYQFVRSDVLPLLALQDHIKIWHAGCATGEEIYSMAIMLTEAGLYEASQLYGTDFNNVALEKAKQGIFPIGQMRKNSINYQKTAATGSLSDYYLAKYDSVAMDSALKKNMIFANHNLATDASFGDMQMIVCRNVLIYFDLTLQQRVLQLFADSLVAGGILCLGSHESFKFSKLARQFTVLSEEWRVYRKSWVS